MLFPPSAKPIQRSVFFICALLMFLLSAALFEQVGLVFVGISILFSCLSLAWHRQTTDLKLIYEDQAKAVLGFFYVGLLPVYADRLMSLSNGAIWFCVLLAVVFSGDIVAYIFGMLWGNQKIMPNISPKKTITGSVGGLLGSICAALVAGTFLPHIPTLALVLMGLVIGAVGQFGDFFESLLKRVANIKDSGTLMPGHGGALDRLDGVLFAAPFVYLTASLFEQSLRL
jgi:phosphatidate cytidylyltransferase